MEAGRTVSRLAAIQASSGRGLGPGWPAEEVSQAEILKGVAAGLPGLHEDVREAGM